MWKTYIELSGIQISGGKNTNALNKSISVVLPAHICTGSYTLWYQVSQRMKRWYFLLRNILLDVTTFYQIYVNISNDENNISFIWFSQGNFNGTCRQNKLKRVICHDTFSLSPSKVLIKWYSFSYRIYHLLNLHNIQHRFLYLCVGITWCCHSLQMHAS